MGKKKQMFSLEEEVMKKLLHVKADNQDKTLSDLVEEAILDLVVKYSKKKQK